jgi:hypothetical protein
MTAVDEHYAELCTGVIQTIHGHTALQHESLNCIQEFNVLFVMNDAILIRKTGVKFLNFF